MANVSVGDPVPEATLTVMTAEGPKPWSSVELLGDGKVVIFAVPGPFTPTCSVKHLPGYIEYADLLGKAGVNRIVCMAVQDTFVMHAWGESSGVGNRIIMAADGNGELTQALGLELDATAYGMGRRSQRFAMIVEDGIIKHLLIDPPGEFHVSSAEHVLSLV